MTNIRNWINLVENTDSEREFYINQANEFRAERSKWWPVSKELMDSYRDGSHTKITIGGLLEWWKNGLLQRDGDKPAWIGADGSLEWYKNGEWHRDDDKPAVIRSNGTVAWFKNGLNHRLLGPAYIDENNKFEWWFRGKQIRVRSQDGFEKYLKKHYPFDNEIKQLYY